MRFLWDLALNIGILSLFASLLCKLKVIQGLLVERSNNLYKKLILAFLMSLICIFSTSTGVHLDNVIVNTRVIGALAAGVLGGPLVGTLTGIIAGAHRYYYDVNGFTTVACSFSAFLAGLMGAFISPYFLRGRWKLPQLAMLTAIAEAVHMIMILALCRPFDVAVATVENIARPMILVNSIGMMIFISTIKDAFDSKDLASGVKLSSALSLADRCMPFFRKGLSSPEKMKEAAAEIVSSTFFEMVMIFDKDRILAKQEDDQLDLEMDQAQNEEFLKISREAMDAGDTVTVSTVPQGHPLSNTVKFYNIYASPLVQWGHPVGCLLVLIRRNWLNQETDRSMVHGLAAVLSTQLELSEAHNQRRLRHKAEYKALQSQINPHFLFNTLNTLACICRENPSKARDLLVTMATYYRQTLDSNSDLISLDKELQQIRNYLDLETARFEEKLKVDFQIDKSISCMVPPLILQPLVENAVKYGADSQGNRQIQITAMKEDSRYVISVLDHGPGFKPEALNLLMNEDGITEKTNQSNRSHIGLLNVKKRLKSTFGTEGQMFIRRAIGVTEVQLCIPRLNAFDEKEEARF